DTGARTDFQPRSRGAVRFLRAQEKPGGERGLTGLLSAGCRKQDNVGGSEALNSQQSPQTSDDQAAAQRSDRRLLHPPNKPDSNCGLVNETPGSRPRPRHRRSAIFPMQDPLVVRLRRKSAGFEDMVASRLGARTSPSGEPSPCNTRPRTPKQNASRSP